MRFTLRSHYRDLGDQDKRAHRTISTTESARLGQFAARRLTDIWEVAPAKFTKGEDSSHITQSGILTSFTLTGRSGNTG